MLYTILYSRHAAFYAIYSMVYNLVYSLHARCYSVSLTSSIQYICYIACMLYSIYTILHLYYIAGMLYTILYSSLLSGLKVCYISWYIAFYIACMLNVTACHSPLVYSIYAIKHVQYIACLLYSIYAIQQTCCIPCYMAGMLHFMLYSNLLTAIYHCIQPFIQPACQMLQRVTPPQSCPQVALYRSELAGRAAKPPILGVEVRNPGQQSRQGILQFALLTSTSTRIRPLVVVLPI